MAIPTYDEFYSDVLKYLADGKEHSRKDIYEGVAKAVGLSKEDMSEVLPKGGPKYKGRIGWSISYLKMAALIDSPRRSIFVINTRGKKALKSGEKIDNNYLKQFPEFQEFMSRKTSPKDNKDDEPEIMDSVSPDEKMNQALEEMNNALISDILTEISNQDPFFFENLVVDVIQAIYGGEFEGSSEVTQKTNDGGIDGVVKQDRLGFNSIYIQAKRHTGSIDRPEIQKFSGAMDGVHATNGAFITSSSFTEGAKVFVKQLNNKHIVLIDGRELAGLMIEYGIGVQTKKVVEIKKIDYDYFHPE